MTTKTPEYSRLCIVPAVDGVDDNGETVTVPMWWDEDRFEAWSGNTFPRGEISTLYSAYLAQNPDVDLFYVVKFHASGDTGWTALNEMAVTYEALVLTEHEHNEADVLNTLLPGEDRTDAEWGEALSARVGSS